jgi:hypothetical protein
VAAGVVSLPCDSSSFHDIEALAVRAAQDHLDAMGSASSGRGRVGASLAGGAGADSRGLTVWYARAAAESPRLRELHVHIQTLNLVPELLSEMAARQKCDMFSPFEPTDWAPFTIIAQERLYVVGVAPAAADECL